MAFLADLFSSPIILIAYISEDASVVGAAFAASNQYLSLPLAVLATLLGLMSGSVSLYYLGLLAHRWHYLKNKIDKKNYFLFLKSN